MWILLLSCHAGFNHQYCVVTVSAYQSDRLLTYVCSTPPPLQEKPVYRLSPRLRCGSPAGALWFPLPPPVHLCPIPATRRTHLKGFVFRADTRHWLARWRHPASGLHHQWRQCCVTHRERISCFTTLLLFLFQPAAFALSFFAPLISSFVLPLWERGVGLARPRL